jgi:hypothetical protein
VPRSIDWEKHGEKVSSFVRIALSLYSDVHSGFALQDATGFHGNSKTEQSPGALSGDGRLCESRTAVQRGCEDFLPPSSYSRSSFQFQRAKIARRSKPRRARPIRPIVLSSKGVWRGRAGVVSLIRTLREEPNTEACKFVVQ